MAAFLRGNTDGTDVFYQDIHDHNGTPLVHGTGWSEPLIIVYTVCTTVLANQRQRIDKPASWRTVFLLCYQPGIGDGAAKNTLHKCGCVIKGFSDSNGCLILRLRDVLHLRRICAFFGLGR